VGSGSVITRERGPRLRWAVAPGDGQVVKGKGGHDACASGVVAWAKKAHRQK